MEHYLTCPYASMLMEDTPEFRDAILKVLPDVDAIVETGTHHGTGSTRILAECVTSTSRTIPIHTIEANAESHAIAAANLAKFPFVTCHLGCSLNETEAAEFLRNDQMLLHHEDYTGIYIDGLAPGADMAEGYLGESCGSRARENVLAEIVNDLQNQRLMIVLDSAGGLGWLEFNKTVFYMHGREFYLLLDDVMHIKHWRSLRHIKNNPEEFHLIAQQHGWALAKVLA